MLRIEASTPQPTANTSIISDITEDLQVGNYTSNHSSPSAPKNLLTTNEISSTSSIELLPRNSSILDKSPEIPPQKADIDAFILNKNLTQTINSIAEKPQTSTTKTDRITGDKAQPATHNNIPFDSGIFQGNQTGKISFAYLSELRTSEKDKELIAEATPKTETKLAQKKADTTSTTNPVKTQLENSPATETKNSTVSEIPNSSTTPADPKTENSPATETKNSTVSEIPNSATTPVETKLENSPATETQNSTVSEIPNSATTPADPKTENSPATETQNPKVSEISNSATTPADPKLEKSPVVEAKNPAISEIRNSATNSAETKPENSPATETQNPKVSEIPNSATTPAD
ncbi:hypothetical protein, partial [Microcoleus anatoxicus]